MASCYFFPLTDRLFCIMSKSDKAKKFESAMQKLGFDVTMQELGSDGGSGQNSANGIFADLDLTDLSHGSKESQQLCTAAQIEMKRQAAKQRLAQTKEQNMNTPPLEKCTPEQIAMKRQAAKQRLAQAKKHKSDEHSGKIISMYTF